MSDTIISLIGAVSLFAIPMNFKKGNFILEWNDTQKLAWGILILFGGGLALAKGMASSGLVALITEVIDFRFLTLVTSRSPMGSSPLPYSSSSSLT